MKIVLIAAALGALTPGLAAAQHIVTERHGGAERTVVTHRTEVREAPARGWHTRKVCSTSYRHHHRVRTCRTVRTR